MATPDIQFFMVNPFEEPKETVQDLYEENMNKAFEILMREMCIPEPEVLVQDGPFTLMINCEGESDVIQFPDYEYKFLKSKFFDFKSNMIKLSLYSYYNVKGIKVTNLYRDRDNYFVELRKYTE